MFDLKADPEISRIYLKNKTILALLTVVPSAVEVVVLFD